MWSLGVVGFLFIVIEYFQKKGQRAASNSISYKNAFIIGTAQSLAVIPGVSRSGATIMSGLLLGIERKDIVEFSFFLAIPTMVAATGYDLLKSGGVITGETILPLLVGFITSFIVAFFAIKWFIKFVQKKSFAGFGIYRIIIAILFLFLVL